MHLAAILLQELCAETPEQFFDATYSRPSAYARADTVWGSRLPKDVARSGAKPSQQQGTGRVDDWVNVYQTCTIEHFAPYNELPGV